MITEETQQPNRSPQVAAVVESRMSAISRVMLVLVVVGGIAALFSAIRSGIRARVRAAATLKQETLEMAVPTVMVVHPRPTSSAEELVLPGNVQAFVATPIFARVNGYLKKWYCDIGMHVQAGQLLAQIETPEIDQQLDQARADLATAQANYALARTTAERYEILFKKEAVAKQDVDNKLGDLQAKKAIVDSATSNVRRLQETQRFQNVFAPFDGVITARNIDIGSLIDAGANSSGKEMFDLAATGRLRVYVNVPQVYSRSATVGRPAQLTLAEFPGRFFPGKIVRTAHAIDPVSRTLLTEVDVDNPTGELLPGAFVSVHFRLGSKSGGVILPANTLIFRSAGLQVALVREGKTVLVPVTMGRDFGNTVELASGVTTADLVIENPSDSLTSGLPVQLAEAQQPAAKGGR
jgi:RND family efflux transporter MFP subunit